MKQTREGAHRRQTERTEPLVHTWRERGGWRARAYRLNGAYVWECKDPAAERITLGIDRRCAFGRAEDGEVLVCRPRCPAWFSLDDAVYLGWCWETAPEISGRRSVTGYTQGETLLAHPPAPITPRRRVWLYDGVRYQCSPDGELLFRRGTRPVGFPLTIAVAEGWCRIDHTALHVRPVSAPVARLPKPSPELPQWNEYGHVRSGFVLARG